MDQIFTRHRFEIRRRSLEVVERIQLSPQMVRLVLKGDLEGFASPSPDDHIKLLFEAAETGGAEKPEMREYTPRAFDLAAGLLTLDFALHGVESGAAGPATAWAAKAAPGDRLQVAGPRGSAEVTGAFDWWLLIGDETALPAIGRWLEEMAPGTPVTTLGLVTGAGEEQAFATAAAHVGHWTHRADPADPAPALAALAGIALPAGRGFVWVGAEAGVARALRDALVDRGQPREWIKAAGYWTRGKADTSDKSLE